MVSVRLFVDGIPVEMTTSSILTQIVWTRSTKATSECRSQVFSPACIALCNAGQVIERTSPKELASNIV